MDNYKRVVSYLYKYKNGNKGKNCGYVRAEKQGTSIKIYISLREEERTDGMLSLSFYMPKEKEPGMQAFCFGHCTMKDGTAEFVFKGSEREFFEAAAADAWQEEKEAVRFFEKYPEHPMRLKLEQISGVLCLWEGYEEEYFCSQWKDGDISPKELTWPAMGGKERGKEQAAEAQRGWGAESPEAEAQGERGAERLEEEAQGQGEREPENPEAEVQGKWSGESSEAEVQGEWRAERLEEDQGQGERELESPEAEVQGKWSGESSEAEVQGEWRAERLEEGAQGQGEREPEHPEIEVWKEKKQGAESLEAEAQGERRGEKQEEDVQGYGNREPEHPEVEVWKEKKQGVESPEAEVQGKWSGESSEAEAQGGWRVGRLAEKDREYGNREREGSEAEVWKEGKQEVERPEAEVQGEWSEGNSEAEAQGGWRAERLAEKDREYGNREPESPEIEVWKEGKQRVERPEEVQGEWSGGRPEAEAQAQRAGNPVRFQGKRPDLMGEDESMRKRIPMASFEQIFKDYPRLMPFSETQGVLDCVRMEPQDIGLFPIKEWELLNNPFLLHGYYCFRHLAYMKKFGKSKKMESKGKKREEYRLGVPGNYTNRERILARLSGFPEFLPAEGEKTEPGTFGYWCRKLELS